MQGYAIVHVQADELAEKDNLVGKFNSFLHRAAAHGISFVQGKEGYFRLPYNDEIGAASAGAVAFGNFLLSAGCSIIGMNSGESAEGGQGTVVEFENNGKTGHVFLTTVFVY